MVAGGAILAQAINLAFSPVITRLFSPEAFGVLGVFLSTVAILSPLSTLEYSLAVALPESDDEARELRVLSLMIASVLGLLLLPWLTFFSRPIAAMLRVPAVAPYLWLVAPLLLVNAYELFQAQWLVRKERFRAVGAVATSQSIAVGGTKVAVGLLSASVSALVVVSAIGKVIHALLLWASGGRNRITHQSIFSTERRLLRRAVAAQYADFPKYRAPQHLLNAASRNLPTIVFAAYFGPSVAGLYSLSQRMLQLPASLISKAVGKVLLPRFARSARAGKSIRRQVITMTLALAGIGAVPFGTIALFGPELFRAIFGQEWFAAGQYARWLSLWLFAGFVNVPAVQSMPFSDSQRFLLVWEVFSSVGKIALLVGVAALTASIRLSILFFSAYGGLSYVVLIAVAIARSDRSVHFAGLKAGQS